MRIVHEIETPMTCGAGRQIGTGRIEVHAFNDCAGNHPDLSPVIFDGQDEYLYIEGQTEYVLAMLRQMLACVENSVEPPSTRESTEPPLSVVNQRQEKPSPEKT